MRDEILRRLGVTGGTALETFERDYRCVRLGDLFSLHFCNGWSSPQDALGYQSELRGNTLVIAPDPFGGATVPIRVLARRIPARRYSSDADLRKTLADVVPELVEGEARGLVPHVTAE